MSKWLTRMYWVYLYRRYVMRVTPLTLDRGGTYDAEPTMLAWPGVQQGYGTFTLIDDRAVYRSQRRRKLVTWN